MPDSVVVLVLMSCIVALGAYALYR